MFKKCIYKHNISNYYNTNNIYPSHSLFFIEISLGYIKWNTSVFIARTDIIDKNQMISFFKHMAMEYELTPYVYKEQAYSVVTNIKLLKFIVQGAAKVS